MCTEMEKDVLLEFASGGIALMRKDHTEETNIKREQLKEIRESLYSSSCNEINYKKLSQEIKEIRKPYETK